MVARESTGCWNYLFHVRSWHQYSRRQSTINFYYKNHLRGGADQALTDDYFSGVSLAALALQVGRDEKLQEIS